MIMCLLLYLLSVLLSGCKCVFLQQFLISFRALLFDFVHCQILWHIVHGQLLVSAFVTSLEFCFFNDV